MFAPAYMGRKRRAEPFQRLCYLREQAGCASSGGPSVALGIRLDFERLIAK